MEHTGTVSDCDTCALSKSRQQAHPNKSTRTTTRPMQLIYTDLMGPSTPPAKGGYRYVSKFTHDYSHMKEVYLLRNKSEAAESLHQYNMTVAVPLGLISRPSGATRAASTSERSSRLCASTPASTSSTPRPTHHSRTGYLRGMDRHWPRSPDA